MSSISNLNPSQLQAVTDKMALDAAQKALEKLADSSRHIKGTEEALTALSSGIQTANGAISLLGLESNRLSHVQDKLKMAIEVTSAAQKVSDIVNKESYFNLVIVANAKNMLTAATNRLSTALNISTAAAKAFMTGATMGLSAALAVVINLWERHIEKQEQAAAAAREQAETERQANAVRLQTRVELERVTESLENFTGSKEQEQAKIDELNQKYGETFGKYDTLAEWYQVLSEKSEAYTNMLFLQAKAQSLINKAVEADARANEIKAMPADNYNTSWLGNNGEKNKSRALRKEEVDRDIYLKQANELYAKSMNVAQDAQIGDFSPKKAKKSTDDGDKNKEAEKAAEKRLEWLKKIAEDELKARQEIDSKLLEAMEEGDDKKKKYAEQAFDDELERIEKERLERLEKLQEAEQAGVEVTPEQRTEVDNNAAKLRNLAAEKYNKELADIEKQAQDAELQAQNNYLKEYGNYEEKRLAIMQDYARQIENAKTHGEKDSLKKKEEAAVAELDKSMIQKSELWKQLFEDADKHTSAYIQKTINQSKQLLDYHNGKADLPTGIDKEVADKLKPEDIKAITDNLVKQRETLGKKNPFVGLINGFKDLKDAGSDTEKQFAATLNIIEGFKGVSAIVNEVGGAVGKMGGSTGETMQKVSGIANSTLSMASTGASIGGPWGAAIGGALGLASGLVGALGADYSDYNAMVQKYDVLMDVWDQLLSKKKAYIKESYGAEATKAGSEALRLLDSEKDVTRQLASSRLNAGKSAGSHSINYRMWKGSYKWEGQNWRDVAGDVSSQLGGVAFNDMYDMLNMSSEQLEWIKTNYSGLWAVMDGDFRGYLDKIIEYGDAEKEIIASVKEQLTGVSLDSFQDSFLSLLDDLDSSSEDFANNFEKYLRKSILQSILAQNYSSKIKSLYDTWASYSSDGNLTEDEVKRLREMQQQMADAMIAERDRLAETFGWNSDTAETSSQSGRSGSVSTVTEETAGKLEGIGLSIQTHVISMDEKMADLSRYSYEAIGLLGSIAENTGYCRCLKDIAEIVNRLERDGMKIKG